MKIAISRPLFAWDCLEDSPSLQSLRTLLEAVPDHALLDSLRAARGKGRDDYPVEVLWATLLLAVALRHVSLDACLEELGRNPAAAAHRVRGRKRRAQVRQPVALLGGARRGAAPGPPPRRLRRHGPPPRLGRRRPGPGHRRRLDGAGRPPVAVLGATETKNRKGATQPLPPDVAAVLRNYLDGSPPKALIWPGTWWKKGAEMLRIDLEAAGIAYSVEGPDGPLYADFHALRHSYVALLEKSGATLKEAMQLARHSDPN